MVPGTYAGKRSADLQAVTIVNIKEEKINEDYYMYATDNLSQQMEKVRPLVILCHLISILLTYNLSHHDRIFWKHKVKCKINENVKL